MLCVFYKHTIKYPIGSLAPSRLSCRGGSLRCKAILIYPNENYPKQNKRLMIIGQQTNGCEYFEDDFIEYIKNSA